MPSNNTSTACRDTSSRGWFKSSHSNPNGNQCVEVFFDTGLVRIRDSKNGGAGPVLTVPAVHWASFLDEVTGRRPAGSNPAIQITCNAGGGATLRELCAPSQLLSYTQGEWSAFVVGVRDGEFDLLAANTAVA